MKKIIGENPKTEVNPEQITERNQETSEKILEQQIKRELIELGDRIQTLQESSTDNLRLQEAAINEGISIQDVELAEKGEQVFRDIIAARAELKAAGNDIDEVTKDIGTKVLTAAERMRQSGLNEEKALENTDFTVVDLATLENIDGSINAESRLLLIGINEYQNPDIQQLKGSINDVKAVKKSVMARYGVAEDQVVVITDRDATKEGILSSISRTAQELTEGQSLLVYYCGHGVRQGERSVIAPHDFQLPVEEEAGAGRDIGIRKNQQGESLPDIESRGISSNEVIDALGGKSSVVITDMCWGGGFHRGLTEAENLTTISSTDYEVAVEDKTQTRDIMARKKEIDVKNLQGDVVARGFWSSQFTEAMDTFGRGIGIAAETAGSIAKKRHGQRTLFNIKGKRYTQ